MDKRNSDRMKMAVGFTMLFLLIVTVIYVLATSKDPSESNLVHLIIGELFGSVTTILTFYFGSSRSSEEKTKMMNKTTEDEYNEL